LFIWSRSSIGTAEPTVGALGEVLACQLSNTLDASFCIDCLDTAINDYGVPEIFNADQGPQFTSDSFTRMLRNHGITISMDRYLLLQYLHSPHP